MGIGQTGGFVVWHRKVFESWLWALPASQFKVAFAIVGAANWKDTQWHNGKEPVIVHRGEFITSQEHLAKACKVTRKVVRSTLNKLQAANMIEVVAGRASAYTLIKVINYSTYQDVPEPEGQPGASEGPVKGQSRASEGPQVNKGTSLTKEQGNKNISEAGTSPNTKKAEIREAAQGALDLLNTRTNKPPGRGFTVTKPVMKLVTRLMKEGYTAEDLRDVVKVKCIDWEDDPKMSEHLVPSTLFVFDKFAERLTKAQGMKAAAERENAPRTKSTGVLADLLSMTRTGGEG